MALENRSSWLRAGDAAATGAVRFDEGLRSYMLGVYNYMASGVLLSGIVAWMVANTSLIEFFYTRGALGAVRPSMLTWGAMLVSVGLVFFLSARAGAIRASTAQTVFWAYAALNGVWLSNVLLIYSGASVARVFFITAASFAALSLYGYSTRRDLNAMGSFMIMGLFGLIIGSVVNIFLQSSAMQWVMSIIGVLVFSGLTAYDTQKVKEMYLVSDGAEVAAKKSVLGALTLYLDFINLFLMLLRLFGRGRD